MQNIKRGDIYYISYGESKIIGSEQMPGRPAVIVSNDKNNEHSTTIEIVYLTTKYKADLPTHVVVNSSKYRSTALCEQITTVSISRLGDYIGEVTAEELEEIDRALAVSLDLNPQLDSKKLAERIQKTPVTVVESSGLVTRLQVERDLYKKLYEDLLTKAFGK